MSNAKKIIHRLQLLLLIVAIAGIGSAVYQQAKVRLVKKDLSQRVIVADHDGSATLGEPQQALPQKIAPHAATNMQILNSLHGEGMVYQLSRYRAFLRDVNILISNFLTDTKHDNGVQILELPFMPVHINQILKKLYQFQPVSTICIFPKNEGWFGRLIAKSISIDRSSETKIEEKKEILKNLPLLQDYLYSDALLHQFLDSNTIEHP